MTNRLKIAFAQMNQRVGDLEGNASAILEMRRRAAGADLLMVRDGLEAIRRGFGPLGFTFDGSL